MANECYPVYEPGAAITAHCTGTVVGKRFVKVSAAKEAGSTLTPSGADTTTGGNIQVAQAAAGEAVLGVADKDGSTTSDIGVLTGGVVPMTSGGAITAGTDLAVASDVNGKAVAAATTGTICKCGIPLSSTTGADQEVLVLLLQSPVENIA